MENKRKKLIVLLCIFVLLIALVFLIYPRIEFFKDGKLYVCRFSGDFSEFEENASYNELYFYNSERDISLKNFEVNKFLCFYVLRFDYIKGDVRKTQFRLEEDYIRDFLENAEIKENELGIDLAKVIENKKAVVGNKRYLGNEYDKAITYELYGKEEILYIFESDGLAVIQVGFSDESPKFIAYK